MRMHNPSADTDAIASRGQEAQPAIAAILGGSLTSRWLCAARGHSRYAVSITISMFQTCVDGHQVVWIVRPRKFVERQFKASMGVLVGRRLTENKISAAALSGFEIKTQLIGFGHAHQDAVADDECF